LVEKKGLSNSKQVEICTKLARSLLCTNCNIKFLKDINLHVYFSFAYIYVISMFTQMYLGIVTYMGLLVVA
jgi:hypothetical protein